MGPTTTLKEYLIKGFAINDQKLKKGGLYFEELLERIRDIRSSEKVFYHKIRDIYINSWLIMTPNLQKP
jgi:hypothetical protein